MAWHAVPRWRGRRYRNRMVHDDASVLGHRVRQPVRALQPDFRLNGPPPPTLSSLQRLIEIRFAPTTTPPDLNTLRSPLVCCDA